MREKERNDLAEDDVVRGGEADVTVEDLKNDASAEDALGEVVRAGGGGGRRRRSGLSGGTLFL